jgi:DNA-directed RNA polymerase specialized sigma24 family protein
VSAAIAALTPEARAVLGLVVLERLSDAQVAQVLDVPEAHARDLRVGALAAVRTAARSARAA